MTAEPDLLPLPAPDYLLPLGPDHDDISMWSENTIRQIVAHATAPLQAEIEALRAEVERLQSDTSFATAISSLRREKERAERLAEALALLPDEIDMVEHNPDEGPLMFCCGRACGCRGVHGLLITHDEECWYVRMRALRDHDQEDRND